MSTAERNLTESEEQAVKATWEGSVEELKGLVSDRAMTGETMLLNMGPHHPSTHGVLRLLLVRIYQKLLLCPILLPGLLCPEWVQLLSVGRNCVEKFSATVALTGE